MINIDTSIGFVLAYLFGSVPTAVWVGQIFQGIDVREYGSGNAGATNTFRVLGPKFGVPVLLIDIFKGWAAVWLATQFGEMLIGNSFVDYQLALGIGALVGHIFPVFAGFRGGKGIATLLGIIIAVQWQAALVAMSIFILVFLVSRIVSLSSMMAAISFPFVVVVVFKTDVPSLTIFSMFIAVLVLVTHQKNIERLIRNEESKISFGRKNGVDDDWSR